MLIPGESCKTVNLVLQLGNYWLAGCGDTQREQKKVTC